MWPRKNKKREAYQPDAWDLRQERYRRYDQARREQKQKAQERARENGQRDPYVPGPIEYDIWGLRTV